MRTEAPRLRAGDLLDGWRYILTHPALRPLFFNAHAGGRLFSPPGGRTGWM